MTRSRLLAVAVGVMLPLLMSTAALAHAVIQPGNAPAGEATTFQVLIPHGCAPGEPPPPPGTEVSDTRLVSVEIPEGVEVAGASEPGDFTVEIADEAITWSGGVLANEDPGEFTFDATLTGDDGANVVFNVYQECTDDLNYRWNGEEGSDTPAPVVVIGSEAPAGDGHDEMAMSASEGASESMDMAQTEATEMASEMADDAEATEMASEMADDAEATEMATEEMPTEESTEVVDATAGDETTGDAAAPDGAPATGQGGTASSTAPVVVGGLAVAMLAGAGAVMARRRQRG